MDGHFDSCYFEVSNLNLYSYSTNAIKMLGVSADLMIAPQKFNKYTCNSY